MDEETRQDDVMLDEEEAPETESTFRSDLTWFVAILLFATMAVTAYNARWNVALQGHETIAPATPGAASIATSLFTTYVVAFEILGVLLLAALFGAIVIALREGSTGWP